MKIEWRRPWTGGEKRPVPGLGRATIGRLAVAVVLAAPAIGWGSPATAQVSCADPNNLCVGNPCVTRDVEVISPCDVDFGTRTLRIGGKLRVPNGGSLTFRARSIFVDHPILGRHTTIDEGDGASITLIATEGLRVSRRIDVSARNTGGRIELVGGDVIIRGPLRAKTKGKAATATGGDVVAVASGILSSLGGGRTEVRGGLFTSGGTVTFEGGVGVDLRGRIDARGSSGGSVTITGVNGGISVIRKIEADGRREVGGSVLLDAAGPISIGKKVLAAGRTAGGSISMSGRTLSVGGPLRVRSTNGPGGSVSLSGEQLVVLNKDVAAPGAQGGTIDVTSSAGTIRLNGMLDVTGRRTAGGILTATADGDLIANGVIEADGHDAGGSIGLTAGQMLLLTPRTRVFAEGDAGGFVDLLGSSAVVERGADLEVDGDSVGGEVRITATSGNLVLSGQFRARGDTGGVIEGMATGDLTADGDFQSRTAGCTALAAGGTLDTADGGFDGPVQSSCD